MLEHHQEPHPAPSRSLPANADPASPQIEAYLDQVLAPLGAAWTEKARQELRMEMRTHLQELVAAYLEVGDTPEQAVLNAIRQFGNSRSVRREWKRVAPDSAGQDLRQGVGIALALYGLTAVLFAVALYGNGSSLAWASSLWLLYVPAGIGTGLLARRHPVRSACYVQTLLYLPMMSLYVRWLLWPKAMQILENLGVSPSLASIGREILWGQHSLLLPLGTILLLGGLGVLVGSLCASVGGWLRRQTLRLCQRVAS